MTRDPVAYRRSGVNLVEYVGGYPVVAVDPFGLTYVVVDPVKVGQLDLARVIIDRESGKDRIYGMCRFGPPRWEDQGEPSTTIESHYVPAAICKGCEMFLAWMQDRDTGNGDNIGDPIGFDL